MSELEDRISRVLNDPEAMAGILDLAKSLGASPQSGAESSGPAEDGGSAASLSFPASELLRAAGQLDGREAALFQALGPFIRPDRREKLDRAVRAARISRIAGAAIRGLGDTSNTE